MSKKNKQPLDNQVKKALITGVCSIACVAIVVSASLNCVNILTSNELEISKLRAATIGSDVTQGYSQQGGEQAEQVTDDAVADNTASGAESADSQAESGEQAKTAEGSSANNSQQENNKETSPLPTKEAQLNYFNTAVNKIKSQRVGYTKHHVMQAKGSVDGIPSWLIGLVTKDKTTTMKKGSDNKDDFPVGGYDWVSKLTVKDIKDISFKQNGDNYEFYITLGTEQNPSKGNSSYGRIFSVIDANGAKDMVGSALKSINMKYHDGYAKAVINSKTGNVISAEFSASADIQASIMLVGDILVTDIVSTESYTDFKY